MKVDAIDIIFTVGLVSLIAGTYMAHGLYTSIYSAGIALVSFAVMASR